MNIKLFKNKISIYTVIFLIFLLTIALFNSLRFYETSQLHTLFEMSAFYLTSFIGVIALLRYHSNKSNITLLNATAFIGIALLHLFYAIITSSSFAINLPSYLDPLTSWTWYISSIYLAILMVFSGVIGILENKFNKLIKINKNIAYLLPAILLLTNYFIFIYVPLPDIDNPDPGIIFHDISTLVISILFILAAIGYFLKRSWKNNNLEYFLILGLTLNAISQLYMTFSSVTFDEMFNLAYIFRFLAYSFIFTGSLINIYQIYKQEKTNEKRVRYILNNMADGVIAIDDNCIIESCNPAVEKMFNYTRSEIMGKKIDILIPHNCIKRKRESDFSECILYKYFSDNLNIKGRKADGSEFPIETDINELNFEGKHFLILVIRDVTKRREVEKMKDEFISTVSHELRTPLTSIKGALSLVLSGYAGSMPNDVKDFIEIAHNNSARLINLINDILDIEKIEAGKMEFNTEIQEILPIINQSLDANASYAQQYNIKFELDPILSNVKVKVDRNRLIQVITNLLSNAVKFSPQNSTVKISMSRHNNYIRIAVSDSGSGIPIEFQDKIFHKFAQADSSDTRQKGGTGLGLNICKTIIERLGGKIGFITEINVGTTFYFDLPEFTTQIPKIAARDFHTPHILICEDDRDVALLISLLLKHEGYSSDIAYNAEQTKQLLLENDYDALTLDLILPDQDGIALIRELREQPKTENLPIIVVSVKADEGSKEVESHFAVLDWINKPIDQTKLLNTIKRSIINNQVVGKPKILHVEDDLDVQKIVRSILINDAFMLQTTNLKEAKRFLDNEDFDLVLLDLELPDGNGAELLPLINNAKKRIFTVIFSAYNVDEKLAQQVDAVLLKTKTSNQDLLNVISSLNSRKDI